MNHDIKLRNVTPKRKSSLLRNPFSDIIIYAMDSTKHTRIRLGGRSLDIVAATAPGPVSGGTSGGPLSDIRVVLAPLCGITDAVFRKICLDRGADMAVTEMISSEGLVRNSPHVRSIRGLDMAEGPLSLQIFGADPEIMGEAAAILSGLRPRFIDLNFGCPVRKIVNKNGGSAVLKNLELLGRICRRVVKESGVPVSAKIRSGWDKPTAVGVKDIARTIEDAGVSMITVHARAKSQAFSAMADWMLIKAVKDAVSIPVVGNGDVTGPNSYFEMKAMTGCDAVMIGRAAIGNPWIFEEIAAAVDGRDYTPPSFRERVEGLLCHVRSSVRDCGEPLGIVSARRIMSAYLKRLPNAREIRSKIMTCTRLGDLTTTMDGYLRQIEQESASNTHAVAGDTGMSLC
ncbi:MAG: tRNA dihydrouridine synthase DusB [Candidatus Latescibacterota bacterium]|nr:MAG: tRNA dihydrouridine synthase DusB [Candidatus Latescibacterota bacterium]